MRPHLAKVACLLTVAMLLQACAMGRMTPSVLGRDVKVVPRADGPRVRGELLVVDADRIVVLARDGVHEVAIPQIREVRVRRHGFDGKKAWTWTLVGALVSGIGLAVACSSVEGTDGCGGDAAAGAVPWLLFGGLSALSTERTAFRAFDPGQKDLLRPFARYPQGLPPEFDLRDPVKPPLAKR
ncbi:MAG: hypothetical protein JNL48_20070 [Acidobacteria bacterium]|nr:hypothetical protein [Acidobacteriota bacterium]